MILTRFLMLLVGFCILDPIRLGAELIPTSGHELELNRIYQYFVPSTAPNSRSNSGAYLWVPPGTPKIRAVMVGVHNALTVTVLENPAVREVCRRHRIAQILLTPNGSDIGSIMLKDLNYDITDPEKTAIYDHYINALAAVSEHPELVLAPTVPLGHSAYLRFPFDVAIRKPEQCLAAIPIKSGMADVYNFYGTAGQAKNPDSSLALRNVPILFISSASQETVTRTPYPRPVGNTSFLKLYRRDHNDDLGTVYEPHNELMGMSWEMVCGHFDMLPRDYQYVADWLDEVATRRLPATPEAPLINLELKDGWLLDPKIPLTATLPETYPQPAPYLDFKGERSKAIWFPNGPLAQRQLALMHDEPLRQVEQLTLLDPQGQPVSLAENALAIEQNPIPLLRGDGRFTLTTHHFTAPYEIDTAKGKGAPPVLANVMFPNATTLPLSSLPMQFNPNESPVELIKREDFKDERGVAEVRFNLRLKRHRLAPDSGFTMFFPRIYDQGNAQFAAAGRTGQIAWSVQDFDKGAAAQTVTFPPIADAPVAARKVALKATSSSGLPVDYFVLKGPGLIEDGAFIPTEVPIGAKNPIEVTIGAYQVGVFQTPNGVRPSPSVYQTFHLTPEITGKSVVSEKP